MDGILSLPYFYIAHVLVISARVGAALLFAPIWGYPGIPQTMRILLVFTTAIGLAAVTPFSPQAYSNPLVMIPGELLIGTLLSMSIRIAFAGLHMGGQMLSYHLGFSAVQAIDPQTQNRSTLMSVFTTMFGYVLILAANQHHEMIRALSRSYDLFPMGASIQTSQWFDALFVTAQQIFVIGWKIALPVFIATFLIEIVVGLIARMQPQINTMVVTAPLKLLIGLFVLGASLSFLPRALGTVMETMILRP